MMGGWDITLDHDPEGLSEEGAVSLKEVREGGRRGSFSEEGTAAEEALGGREGRGQCVRRTASRWYGWRGWREMSLGRGGRTGVPWGEVGMVPSVKRNQWRETSQNRNQACSCWVPLGGPCTLWSCLPTCVKIG